VEATPAAGAFARRLRAPLAAAGVEVLQVNLGDRCNLACRHCHVEAGPSGAAAMSREVMERCLEVLRRHPIPTIDLTGGAPELHPDFRWFLGECAALGRRLLVRSNLAVLLEEGSRDLPERYAAAGVELVASLPSLDEGKTDRQRGGGVFRRVIEAMRLLNGLGYARVGSGLALDLVHNPTGAYLPGCQRELERQYRETLARRHGVTFTRLFCITNMPIGRYLAYLRESGNLEEYLDTLAGAFNPAAVDRVMCRTTVSVAPDGTLHDCDFNQVLGLPVNHGAPDDVRDFDLDRLAARRIVVADHCFGCTAGAGSSCQGEVAGS
jgi:radical SAM/Cys-rich protein